MDKAVISKVNPIPVQINLLRYENKRPKPNIILYYTNDNQEPMSKYCKYREELSKSLYGRHLEKETIHKACEYMSNSRYNSKNKCISPDNWITPCLLIHSNLY